MKKHLIAIACIMLLSHALYAEDSLISTVFRVQQGDNLLSAPTVTAKANHPFKIEVTQPFVQAPGLSLSTGVILDGKTEMKNGKILYSFILTVREFEGDKSTGDQKASAFKTREYLLSGDTLPGKEIKLDLGSKMLVSLTLSLVKPDEKKSG